MWKKNSIFEYISFQCFSILHNKVLRELHMWINSLVTFQNLVDKHFHLKASNCSPVQTKVNILFSQASSYSIFLGSVHYCFQILSLIWWNMFSSLPTSTLSITSIFHTYPLVSISTVTTLVRGLNYYTIWI